MRVSDERADDAGKSLLGSVINIANRAGAFDEKILFNGDDAKVRALGVIADTKLLTESTVLERRV